jgi:NADPH:quinone reductase-like Zn-dependent oxidoreductase
VSIPENPGHDSRLQDVVFDKPDLLDLTGRVIVVTGAGSGFGRTTAILAARYGATVIASDIDERRVT